MKTRSGFSLAEMAVAAGLIASLLVPVLIFSQRGVVEAGVTQEELLGRQLLMDLCERYKAASPDELAQVAAHPERIEQDDYVTPLKRETDARPFRFARAIGLERNVDGVDGLHRVTFTVAWTSRHRPNQRATLSRLIHWHE